ncbi:hypothetical protein WDU94_005883 [Cyamophila willieti]
MNTGKNTYCNSHHYMSITHVWISTLFCLILIQGHSADIQQVRDDTEGICMKNVDQKEPPQCGEITTDEIGALPKIMDMEKDAHSKDAPTQDSVKETNQEPIEVVRRDIESKEQIIAPPPPPPPPRKLEKLPKVEVLLEVEEKMLNFVRDYVENETLRLEQLNKNLAHWTTISNYSMADPQGYLSVYLNCFHLLKRMAFDIPNDILNFSLYDDTVKEEDLNQWDIYSEDHHLVSYINSSPHKLELLDSLDAHGLLSLVNSNPELSVPESTMVDVLSKSLHRPLDLEELISEDKLLDELLEYVTNLDQKQYAESSKLLIESAKLKYPLNEKLASAEQ